MYNKLNFTLTNYLSLKGMGHFGMAVLTQSFLLTKYKLWI